MSYMNILPNFLPEKELMVHLKQTVLLFEAQLLHPAQHYFLCLGHLFLQANVEIGLLGLTTQFHCVTLIFPLYKPLSKSDYFFVGLRPFYKGQVCFEKKKTNKIGRVGFTKPK